MGVKTRVIVGVLLTWTCVDTVAVEAQQPTPSISTIATDQELPSQGRLGGVAVGGDGTVYVSNFGASVWRVTPEGHTTLLTNTLRGSSGNAVYTDGSLLQASFAENRIVRVTPEGEVTDFTTEGLDGPVGIAVDADGHAYTCNCRANSITKTDRHGSTITFAVSPLLACPNGITVDGRGDLYVVSFANTHVVRITPEGDVSLITTLPGDGNAHVVAVGEHLYVSRIRDNTVVRVAHDGTFETFAGSGEDGNVDGFATEASLAHPNGIARDRDGRFLYVNTLLGTWRGNQPTRLLLRRIGPVR